MKYAEQAEALFRSGCNCAQAVVGAFADVYGVDVESAMRMTAALGGGLARQRELCGAVVGMGIVLGMAEESFDPKDYEAKKALYGRTQTLCARFAEEHGSILCRDLLDDTKVGGVPSQRTDAYYASRPCAGLVRFAAALLEEELFLE